MLRLPVDRPVTTIMLFLGLALLGVISWLRLPQELFPSLEYPQISIVTKYEGAGPEESEKLISKLVEEAVGTVKNIKGVKSVSKEGLSIVTCEFRWGTDMNFAAMDVREKIDLVKQSIPKEAHEPVVLKFNPFQVEAIILSVSFKEKTPTEWELADLRYFCKKHLKDELERLDGVAKVDLRGGAQKEVLVEIDKGRLIANQVSLNDVIKSLRDANVTYPAGVIKEDRYEYLVKTVGEFQTIGDISALSFGKEESGSQRRSAKTTRRNRLERQDSQKQKITYVKDIADVKYELKDITGYSRYNERDNISLGIYPQSGANLIKISKLVSKRLEELKERFPKDVDVEIIYDQSEFIKASLDNIYTAAWQGGLLSIIVLYLFLGNMTAALIVASSIPLTILMAASMMYFMGMSINTMSLGGLALGVGMVVDNANIVIESIYGLIEKNPGKERKEIIYEATVEMVSSIIASTATTICIFLPFILVAGMAGQLFKELAYTVSFSMIASVMTAVFMVPRLILGVKNVHLKPILTGYREWFEPLLKQVLKMPKFVPLFALLAYTVVGGMLFFVVPKEFMPKVDEKRFVLNINLPPKTPLEINNQVTKRIEDQIMKIPELESVSSSVGSTGDEGELAAITSLNPYQSRILAKLKWGVGRKTKEVVAQLNDQIVKWGVKGLELEFITQQGLFGSSLGASAGLTIEVKGKDLAVLRKRSEEIVSKLKQVPELYGIKIDPSELVPEFRIEVDRERASLFGLSTQDISAMALAAIKGFVATRLKQKEEEFDIRVRLRPEDRDTLDKVGEMAAFSQWGMMIQLKQVSRLNFVESLPEIKRIEGQRTYLITTNIKKDFNKTVETIGSILDRLPPIEDVSTEITGELLALKESASSSMFALILGVIIVFMILASQFESLSQPIITMTVVPMGYIGALYTLFLTGQSINSISMLGFIMLTGNVVSISIILVDRYNAVMREHPNADLLEVIVENTGEHLRPVICTTLTTVIDLIPLAIGMGQGSEAMRPMAITMLGGLTFGLVLALFYVPIFYLTFMKKKPEAAVINIALRPTS